MRIAIVDVLGLPYDGTTVFKRGIGGSESAVIYLSAELVKIGFEVTVFCCCDIGDTAPGEYNGVRYLPLDGAANDHGRFDILVSSRSVEPFLPPHLRDGLLKKPNGLFDRLVQSSSHKILWMHDTFCHGDHVLEQLVVEGYINELFVLSDWHMTYVLNCDHGRRRNYEVLKNRTFVTRNGVHNWIDWVDTGSKNPNQYVYNASVSKGMEPLLRGVWPIVKHEIPEATLKVIGGYYNFGPGVEPDEQEQKWHALKQEFDSRQGIEFTGVITQQEIAHVLAASTWTLYPNAFPETFGISSVESLNYLTPVITNRFGALEETAVDLACYKIDYAIEPNSLFPHIPSQEQIARFARITVEAHHNRYLLYQKQNYCSAVRPLVGWDHVALQWKQHFYQLFDRILSRHEFETTSLNQLEWNRIFGRRTVNSEQRSVLSKPEQALLIVSATRNSQDWIERHILSVANQNYSNWHHLLIDDASTDLTASVAQKTISSLDSHSQQRITLQVNTESKGAVANHAWALHWSQLKGLDQNTIVMLLDGDDWLVNRNDIFSSYNWWWTPETEFSYGSCWSVADQIPLIAQEYPPDVKANRSYRNHRFPWLVPYTHLRAFRLGLAQKTDQMLWKDQHGNWLRAGGDTAVFLSLIEQADPRGVKAIPHIVVNYNDINPLNDYKINKQEQTRTAEREMNKPSSKALQDIAIQQTELESPVIHRTKKVLIGVPTAKYIETETFKSIFDLCPPSNTELEFQYFWGYNVEQVRNIMVAFTLHNGFDALMSVDSDIILKPDTLQRLTAIQTQEVAITSGVYVQRKPGLSIPEIYVSNNTGGLVNPSLDLVLGDQVIEVGGVGFGACLVRRDVFEAVGNPWFVYHSNIDFEKVLSEDVDFCIKARNKGYKIAVDTGVKLTHISKSYLEVAPPK
jgi:GT2 family glycosyltransferase